MSKELVAARVFLDEEHEMAEHVSQYDYNVYILGRIGKHNVVIAALPDREYGTSSTAAVARDMLSSFPNVRIVLIVGIGGGVPSKTHDIRLGDVVISSSSGGNSGVYQYDFWKTIRNRKFVQTGVLDSPPTVLYNAITTIKLNHESDGNQIDRDIDVLLNRKPR
jgi:nucleoside phosphorylase